MLVPCAEETAVFPPLLMRQPLAVVFLVVAAAVARRAERSVESLLSLQQPNGCPVQLPSFVLTTCCHRTHLSFCLTAQGGVPLGAYVPLVALGSPTLLPQASQPLFDIAIQHVH